jgi:hypothetical protein
MFSVIEAGRGAYGLVLGGALADHEAFRVVRAPHGALELADFGARGEPLADLVRPGHVVVSLADGSQLEAFSDGDMRYRATLKGGPARSFDDLVHPYLAPVAALIHRWRGAPAIHGAAVSNGNGAVALIGSRGYGKTTTAAALVHERGLMLLSDDLVVVAGVNVLPGPLSLDMRPDGSKLLGLDGETVRNGERRRRLAPQLDAAAEQEIPLRLCVHLEFGDRTRVRPVSAANRLTALAAQLYWPGVGAPAMDLLSLIALPQIVLERPVGRRGLEEGMDAILATLDAC